MQDNSGNSATPFGTTGRSRRGEPWVWLTATGLSIGVTMALGLLLLILFKGGSSFWPRRIDVMEVSQNGAVERIAGYITQQSERRDADGGMHEEVQIFRGNKDLHGEAFRYVDRSEIVSVARPADMLLVQRMEHGPAIVKGVAVSLSDGRIAVGEPGYPAALDRILETGRESRAAVRRIERSEIGAINREMEALERELRAGRVAPEAAAARQAELQAKFETLKAEVDRLRAQAQEYLFEAVTVDGREVEVSARNLVHVFPANEAGAGARLGEMVRRIKSFVSEDPREANTDGGVFPAIFGTVVMTLVMSFFVTPFGVMAAIYLREYAKQGLVVRVVRISVNNLAGVPSIVFGVFGLAFFVYYLGGGIDELFYSDRPGPTFGTPGILWASLTLAILTLPVVIVATEEALSAVPRGVREAALACGASKWQTIQRVVLPASLPGILTGVILAMARGAGEVAPLMLVGVVKLAPSLPIDDIAPFIHPERKFMHLGFHIYDLGFQSPDSEAAKPMVYATALLLILVVVSLNLAAILIRNRLKKRFAVSSF